MEDTNEKPRERIIYSQLGASREWCCHPSEVEKYCLLVWALLVRLYARRLRCSRLLGPPTSRLPFGTSYIRLSIFQHPLTWSHAFIVYNTTPTALHNAWAGNGGEGPEPGDLAEHREGRALPVPRSEQVQGDVHESLQTPYGGVLQGRPG